MVLRPKPTCPLVQTTPTAPSTVSSGTVTANCWRDGTRPVRSAAEARDVSKLPLLPLGVSLADNNPTVARCPKTREQQCSFFLAEVDDSNARLEKASDTPPAPHTPTAQRSVGTTASLLTPQTGISAGTRLFQGSSSRRGRVPLAEYEAKLQNSNDSLENAFRKIDELERRGSSSVV